MRRNRRRYGGYIVHVGIALLFVGVAASSAFQHAARRAAAARARRARVGGYDVRYVRADRRGVAARTGGSSGSPRRAARRCARDGKLVRTLRPTRGYYPARRRTLGPLARFFEGEATSEVGLSAGVRRDLWTAVEPDLGRLRRASTRATACFDRPARHAAAGRRSHGARLAALDARAALRARPPPATFRVIVSPLVTWIWLGGLIVFAGGAHRHLARAATRRAPRRAPRYAARVARELGRA